MPDFLDTVNEFNCTGEYDFRNATVLIATGSTLPTITKSTGEMFLLLSATRTRLYWTINGKWYFKDAL